MFKNTNLKEFISVILLCATVQEVLDKCESDSEKGFVYERLWDLVIKFGFCVIFSNSQYTHKMGNANLANTSRRLTQ